MARIVKTVSFNGNNKIIEEFIKKQKNFSESVRYLILSHCAKNGIEDLSKNIDDLIYESLSGKNIITSRGKDIKDITLNEKVKPIQENKPITKKSSENIPKKPIPECYS